ncbi:sensor histidine kinase [Deinococcus cellulosilyticus]|uniref:histidine kinase n=1 Tax=Deinococcus cellulosilyticus (strain DSM 18568 / NBRC 106333 / KACC 11606 / 5516J-15) TaxID=1223518 RepID=A0A511MYK7_DEIC1|nr:ATP-binding protein [Deinococcus cellulosilyticus]GEM45680.1 hypothetical protein DC3_13150 [Deinococcus cellulosilyticus NBRC 106333 = KACC 11606]
MKRGSIYLRLLGVMLFLTISTPVVAFLMTAYTISVTVQGDVWNFFPKQEWPTPEAQVLGERLRWNALWAALISAGLASMVALVLARGIAQPLVQVGQAARKITDGNLSARAPASPQMLGQEAAELVQHFNEMAEGLEKLEAGRKRMMADIAHELRTPLAVLQARLDGLEDGMLTFDQQEARKLSLQVGMLNRLVEDLRLLTLANTGQLPVQQEAVNLKVLFEDVISSFAIRAEQNQLTLTLQVPAEDVTLTGDADRLAQVLSNLLENSLRHARSQIEVQVFSSGTFSVEDDGQGVPEQELSRIFELYYRTDESRSREKGGSGLGLPLVQAFLQAHGGHATAEKGQWGGLKVTCQIRVN